MNHESLKPINKSITHTNQSLQVALYGYCVALAGQSDSMLALVRVRVCVCVRVRA